MTADMAGERELFEKLFQSFRILTLIRIDLRVGALEIGRAEHAGAPCPGPAMKTTSRSRLMIIRLQ